MSGVAITGFGVFYPDTEALEPWFAGERSARIGAASPEDVLGAKGLRYKDSATRMALAAGRLALARAGFLPGSPGGPDLVRLPGGAAADCFGVAASSNFGNMDTVCRVAAVIQGGHTRDTSPMDLPNASSNVIASSLAIRFGLRGVNLMLCNGSTSGTQAAWMAATAIRAGRASRMLVVGAECGHPDIRSLLRQTAHLHGGSGADVAMRDGAAALVLESPVSVRERGTIPLAWIGDFQLERADFGPLSHWLPPAPGGPGSDAWIAEWREFMLRENPGISIGDLEGLGETSGALGVLQGCMAVRALSEGGAGRVLATSGGAWGDAPCSLAYDPDPAEDFERYTH